MLGNIWLSSALIITAIFSASALYKSYSDIQEAKQIQENYEIISGIKILLAKQYNKNSEEITRDEIIINLPNGANWEKILLLDRNKDSNLTNKELVNGDGDIDLSIDEKLKVLVLKAKVKNITDVSTIIPIDNKYIFEVGKEGKNSLIKDIDIENSINKAIHFLAEGILYTANANKSVVLTNIIEEFTPFDKFYFDFLETGETSISDEKRKTRQKVYFRLKIKEKLHSNNSAIETRLYKELESLL